MNVSRARIVVIALCVLGLSACPKIAFAATQPAENSVVPVAPLHEEVLSLPGDPDRPVKLQVTLYLPDGKGPFPLVVMNHGATKASDANRGERYRFTIAAYYFLSRGYAVALPMARGFAGSGGNLLHLGCDLTDIARKNGRDISGAIEALSSRPDIDRTRIVIAGQSFGGWTTLGLGEAPPAGVRGLIAFNAAIRTSDCPTQDGSMIAAATWLGADTKLPSLWFYGDNDSVMPEATWRSVYLYYKRAGAHTDLVAFGRWGADFHQLLSSPESMPIWTPRVDAFLKGIGLPSAVVYPDYLPYQPPAATGWAALTDVAAVPVASNELRTLYRRFLAAPKPRVFVITPNGRAGEAHGGYDPAGHTLRSCIRVSPACRIYAIDDDVVWSGPKPGPASAIPPRVVHKTVAMNVSTPLGGFYALNPDCSSRGLPKVSIVDPPAHGTAAAAPRDQHPAFPPGNPFAVCDTAMIQATGLSYTPAADFAGADAFTIDEVGPEGKHQVIRIELTVK